MRGIFLSLLLAAVGYCVDELVVLKTLEEKLKAGFGDTEKRTVGSHDSINGPDESVTDLLRLLTNAKTKREHVVLTEHDHFLDNLFSNDDEPEKQASCVDVRDDCSHLKSFFSCDHISMKAKCAKSCKICYPCQDTIAKEKCLKFQNLGYCKYLPLVSRMKDLCYETCGFCRTSSPPACQNSPHGCCWDKYSIKNDAQGTNCPPCVDQRPTVCKTFKANCESDRRAGQWMRRNCPVTCDLCHQSCEDSKDFADLCSKIVQKGHCKLSDAPKMFCRKSCKFC